MIMARLESIDASQRPTPWFEDDDDRAEIGRVVAWALSRLPRRLWAPWRHRTRCAGFREILAAWVRARGPEASRRGAVWTRRETSPRTPGRRSSGWSVGRARALATPVGAVREPEKHIAGQPVAGFDGVGAGGAPARTPSRRGSRAPRARRPARTRPWPESVRRGAWFPRESECLRDARSGRPAVACGSVSGEIGRTRRGKKSSSG